MVRVWYEPPPFGPGTDLNRNAYGFHGGNSLPPRMMERLMKMPQGMAIAVPTAIICALCYIPCSKSIEYLLYFIYTWFNLPHILILVASLYFHSTNVSYIYIYSNNIFIKIYSGSQDAIFHGS